MRFLLKILSLGLVFVCLDIGHTAQAQGVLRDWVEKKREEASRDVPVPAGAVTVKYGASAREAYDVYRPTAATSPAPIIVMVHGGGWRIGDKAMPRMIENKVGRWNPRGFIVMSVNYPMLDDGADVAAQVGYVADAIADIQKRAATWNGDASKMIIMGHSAGAHLVSLIGADADMRATHHIKPWLLTVSLDSGSMDVPDTMKDNRFDLFTDAFGNDPVYWEKLSPIHHVSKTSLPWVGVCSTQRTISCAQNNAYAQKSNAVNIGAHVIPENLSHREINENLGMPGDYTTLVEKFIRSADPIINTMLNTAPQIN